MAGKETGQCFIPGLFQTFIQRKSSKGSSACKGKSSLPVLDIQETSANIFGGKGQILPGQKGMKLGRRKEEHKFKLEGNPFSFY